MKINKKPSKKKIIIITILAVLLAGFTYAVVASQAGLFPFVRPSMEPAQLGEQKVSLERSDAEEDAIRAVSEDPSLKSKNDQTDEPKLPTTTTDDDRLKVNVLLTNVRVANGTVSSSGFVTDLVESDGSCTYRFVNGSNVVEKPARTLTNPTSTTCETVRFPTAELQADGNWKVSVLYNSDTATGESAQKEFTK
jgi:hypothetical protein